MTKRFLKKGAFYIFAFIGAFPFSLPSIAIEKEAEERCTILRSGMDDLGGVKIYISDRSLKVQSLNAGTYVVANAPDWRVVLYNPRNNHGLSMSMKEWMVHKPQWIYLTNPADDRPFVWTSTQPQPVVYLGRKCVKAYMQRKYKAEPNSRVYFYTYLPNTNANDTACKILQKLADVPIVEGIPIAFGTFDDTQQKVEGIRRFSTVRIEDRSVPEKFFSYPKNFQARKREADIASDGTRDKLIEDTFGY